MNNLVMAIYPATRGFGFVVAESPNHIIHYRVGSLKTLSPSNYVKRLQKLIEQYRPSVLLLKDYENAQTIVSKRTKKVIESLEAEAVKYNIRVHRHSRPEIRQVFGNYTDNTNKYGIALILAKWYPDLRRMLPDGSRKYYHYEDYYMPIYDAFALMYTHFCFTRTTEKKNNEE